MELQLPTEQVKAEQMRASDQSLKPKHDQSYLWIPSSKAIKHIEPVQHVEVINCPLSVEHKSPAEHDCQTADFDCLSAMQQQTSSTRSNSVRNTAVIPRQVRCGLACKTNISHLSSISKFGEPLAL